MKLDSVRRNNKGFTLVEILIVIIIIAILVAIAVPLFKDVTDNARHSVWRYNSTYLIKVLALNIYKYDGEDRYEPRLSGALFDYSENSLNNYLEKELENYQVKSNKDRIINPHSRSKMIVNWTTPLGGSVSDGRNPAVFITGNSNYSYTGSGSTNNLLGTIVAYFNATDPYNVQIYYIDKEGAKSEKMADFD